MNKKIIHFTVILSLTILLRQGFSVEYPIYSLGIHGGYVKSNIANGVDGRIYLRYSLEAYVPGFNIDVSYNQNFYQLLQDSVQMWPEAPVDSTTERYMYKTSARNIFPAVSGSFHFKLSSGMSFYAGGGSQVHFLAVKFKQKEKYWDDIGQKYQERDVSSQDYLNTLKFGYHLFCGLKFELGNFGTFDVELRKIHFNVDEEDWENQSAKKRWASKSWDNLTVNAGVTFYIF